MLEYNGIDKKQSEADVRSHKTYKPDWKLELLGLKQMLKQYE